MCLSRLLTAARFQLWESGRAINLHTAQLPTISLVVDQTVRIRASEGTLNHLKSAPGQSADIWNKCWDGQWSYFYWSVLNTRWRLSFKRKRKKLFLCAVLLSFVCFTSFFRVLLLFFSFLLLFYLLSILALFLLYLCRFLFFTLLVSLPAPCSSTHPPMRPPLRFLAVLIECTCAVAEEWLWLTLWEIPSPSAAHRCLKIKSKL